ncbi:hypothetical protein M501DRAFT_990768 [Patellaria atrata CBS 101060]|uniref:G-patch domain-containing protein n=1 Tax=Patellaria atrata CBS 101060 TaxID=1346257 RepID=A0A9P4SDM0_9PEZI|nr:hypothetical protein M501DRAFT_990768 [Patellaria atrata CBS 101060]
MASEEKPLAPRPGMSLYANLLNPGSSATISKEPVLYNKPTKDAQTADETKKQINAALRFQPTLRPQIVQKAKKKAPFPKPSSIPNQSSSPDATGKPAQPPAQTAPKTTLADWVGDDDDVNGFYANRPQRGGKRKKKNNQQQLARSWDDIYDPAAPNSFEEYKNSEERYQIKREWLDVLHAHRRRPSTDLSEDDDAPPKSKTNFAPPPNYMFAPPSFSPPPPPDSDPLASEQDTYIPPPAVEVLNDATGEDAYARRMRLSGMQIPPPPDSPPPIAPPKEAAPLPPPQPPTPTSRIQQSLEGSNFTIVRAPVRYALPPAPEEIPATEEELEQALKDVEDEVTGDAPVQNTEPAPRSNRPGQAKFAERLMAKYGWTKGSGLGATGEGITTALSVKVEKRKKRPDSEGGGFVDRGGRGIIVGGKKAKTSHDDDGPGAISPVVKLWGMVDGMDLDEEMQRDDGGILQEIGDECGQKYGMVERIYIDRTAKGQIPVFVKFTSVMSALRALTALNGRLFARNEIRAKYFDEEKFDNGVYE